MVIDQKPPVVKLTHPAGGKKYPIGTIHGCLAWRYTLTKIEIFDTCFVETWEKMNDR